MRLLFDDRWLKDTGLTTLDFAKAMIDEGYHPMTVYFPLIVHGAMLIEPTESESKASLDLFIMTLRDLALAAKRRRARAVPGGAGSCAAPAARRDARRPAAGAALDEAPAGLTRDGHTLPYDGVVALDCERRSLRSRQRTEPLCHPV